MVLGFVDRAENSATLLWVEERAGNPCRGGDSDLFISKDSMNLTGAFTPHTKMNVQRRANVLGQAQTQRVRAESYRPGPDISGCQFSQHFVAQVTKFCSYFHKLLNQIGCEQILIKLLHVLQHFFGFFPLARPGPHFSSRPGQTQKHGHVAQLCSDACATF